MEPPPELKNIKRFIREATKIEKTSPVVAYYCHLYAIQEAMKSNDSKKNPQVKQWISNAITNLEKMPKQDVTKEKAQEAILLMANNIFDHADETDRLGNSDKQTAGAFNSAGVFYTILKQFGDVSDETSQRIKYCLFKTTDILKAIKEGRKPQPGPLGGVDNDNGALDAELNKISGDLNDDNNDAPQKPKINNQKHDVEDDNKFPSYSNNNMTNPQNNYNFSNVNNNNIPFNQPYPNSMPPPSYQPFSTPYKPTNQTPNFDHGPVKKLKLPEYISKVGACNDAEQLFKEVIAALRFEDADAAITKAQKAINILSAHR